MFPVTRVGLLVCMLAVVGMAQPPADKPADRPPPQEARQPEDREAYKARLERSLAESKRRQERLEAALKKLIEGAPVEEVRTTAEGPRLPNGGQRVRLPQGRPEDRRGPDQGAPSEKLPREEVLAFIEAQNPEVGARFRTSLKDNPSMAGRMIDRFEPVVREIKAERDAEMRQLRIASLKNGFEVMSAARAFGEAHRADPNAESTRAAGQNLRQLYGAYFDLRARMHQQEIVLLERRVAQLREELANQVEGREKFIERRLEDAKRGFRRGDRDGKPGEPKAGEPKQGDRKAENVGEPKR